MINNIERYIHDSFCITELKLFEDSAADLYRTIIDRRGYDNNVGILLRDNLYGDKDREIFRIGFQKIIEAYKNLKGPMDIKIMISILLGRTDNFGIKCSWLQVIISDFIEKWKQIDTNRDRYMRAKHFGGESIIESKLLDHMNKEISKIKFDYLPEKEKIDFVRFICKGFDEFISSVNNY